MVFVSVENPLTGKKVDFKMLLDTGSCHTCLPTRFAFHFGLKNHENEDQSHQTQGIGCTVKRYLHRLRIGLIDPTSRGSRDVVWVSRLEQISFIKELEGVFGILGMDIISEWKELTLLPEGDGGKVRITV